MEVRFMWWAQAVNVPAKWLGFDMLGDDHPVEICPLFIVELNHKEVYNMGNELILACESTEG